MQCNSIATLSHPLPLQSKSARLHSTLRFSLAVLYTAEHLSSGPFHCNSAPCRCTAVRLHANQFPCTTLPIFSLAIPFQAMPSQSVAYLFITVPSRVHSRLLYSFATQVMSSLFHRRVMSTVASPLRLLTHLRHSTPFHRIAPHVHTVPSLKTEVMGNGEASTLA